MDNYISFGLYSKNVRNHLGTWMKEISAVAGGGTGIG